MKIDHINYKKTKIIATAGPKFNTKKQMKNLFINGVNVVRINSSHLSLEESQKIIDNIKEVRKEIGIPISILLDTKGPEIRTHKIENDYMEVKKNQKLQIYCKKEILGKDNKFSITYDDFLNTINLNDEILIDDGRLILKVISKNEKENYVTVISKNDHFIGTKKGINIPSKKLNLPFISDYDKSFLNLAIKNDIDYVAASFVNSENDLIELRSFLDKNGGKNILIMSKIESYHAINNLNKIIKYSDSIMLARGDLGVEIPFYEIPFYEKVIINKCRAWGKPIVVATQMLESMINNFVPTRAEVTDIHYATILGADATMLSAETASGNFSLESVKTMSKIISASELEFNYLDAFDDAYANVESSNSIFSYKIARKAIAENNKYIIAFSENGKLIEVISRFRPKSIIIALISNKDKINKFGVNYGVYAMYHKNINDFNNDSKIQEIAKSLGIKNGEKIIVASKKKIKIIEI